MVSRPGSSDEFFLSTLRSIESRFSRVQRQISSGIRVDNPSDAPGDVRDILRLQAQGTALDQSVSNLERVKSEVDVAESSVRGAIDILDRIRVLAVQGANSTGNGIPRQAIAAQVESLQQQLVQIANVQVEGRYVFGGDMDTAPPYLFDASAPTGAVRLTATEATRQIDDGTGGLFVAGLTATQIFDARNPDDTPSPTNVYAAVNALRLALEQDDPAQVQAAIDGLRGSAEHVNNELVRYGALQNRVNHSVSRLRSMQAQQASRLSEVRDTDIPAAVLELQSTQTQREAALSSQAAAIKQPNLFDYL